MTSQSPDYATCAICYKKVLKINSLRKEEIYYHLPCYQTHLLIQISTNVELIKIMLKKKMIN